MIPRHQSILFVVLLLASAIMGVALWNQLRRSHDRLLQGRDSTPTHAPEVAAAEQVDLLVASDATNSLQTRALTMPLPQNPEARARVILGKLLEIYTTPDAAHPVSGSPTSVTQVFLLPVPAGASGGVPAGADPKPFSANADGPQLAVVNLAGAFASSHPSGIETESLTVLSVCATLHANFPRIHEVRFLVNGQPKDTLAGHADLTRTYLAAEAAPAEGAHP